MILRGLRLTNFKGIAKFTLDTNGKSVTVEGMNGLGKTTLADAYLYLLTGKDSLGSASFEIKGLAKDGTVAQHGLDHEVEAVVEVESPEAGDIEITLKKVFKEKWTTQRGSADKTFTGHETEHFIDGVPKDKKEFDNFVASICDPRKLLILSKPTHFNELPDSSKEGPGWQQRRRVLIEAFGDVTDAEVMAGDKKFKPLVEAMKGKTVDDFKAVSARAKKEAVDKRKGIPGRIDELVRSLPPAIEEEAPALVSVTDSGTAVLIPGTARRRDVELREILKDLQARRAQISAGGEVAEKTKRLRELEAEGQEIYNKLKRQADEEANEAAKALRQANFVLEGDTQLLARHQAEWEKATAKLARITGYLSEKRAEYRKFFAVTIDLSKAVKDACPSCGQALPADQVADAKRVATEEFNFRKAEKLDKIKAEGVELGASRQEALAAIKDKEELIDAVTARVHSLTDHRDVCAIAHQNTNSPDAAFPVVLTSPAWFANVEERGKLQKEIESATSEVSTELIDAEITECEAQIKAQDEAKARVAAASESRARIKELEEQEKTMGAEIENLDRLLFLVEEFTKAKVQLLDDKINSHFDLVQFKLSEVQINGGLQDCCVCTMNGTPWSGLSTGEQIIAGLDVINTLAEAWRMSIPCFVDHRESLTMPYAIDRQGTMATEIKAPGQVIELRAVEGLKKLKVTER